MKTLAKVLACIVVVLLAGCGQDVKPGQVWLCRPYIYHEKRDPFSPGPKVYGPTTQTVVAVEDGYVKYSWVTDGGAEILSSCDIHTFARMADLIKDAESDCNTLEGFKHRISITNECMTLYAPSSEVRMVSDGDVVTLFEGDPYTSGFAEVDHCIAIGPYAGYAAANLQSYTFVFSVDGEWQHRTIMTPGEYEVMSKVIKRAAKNRERTGRVKESPCEN